MQPTFGNTLGVGVHLKSLQYVDSLPVFFSNRAIILVLTLNRLNVGADQIISARHIEFNAVLGFLFGQLGTGLQVLLFVVDDLDVLVSAAVLLVTTGCQRCRIRLGQRRLHFMLGLGLDVWFAIPVSRLWASDVCLRVVHPVIFLIVLFFIAV